MEMYVPYLEIEGDASTRRGAQDLGPVVRSDPAPMSVEKEAAGPYLTEVRDEALLNRFVNVFRA